MQFLKNPTILYHASLAPAGRLFDASKERPQPHPGEDWVDTPADLPQDATGLTADQQVVADQATDAGQALLELSDKNEKLTEELSVALSRATAAEEAVETAQAAHKAEAGAHEATKRKLDDAGQEIVALSSRIADLEAEVAKVPELVAMNQGLSQQIADKNAQIATLTERADAPAKGAKRL